MASEHTTQPQTVQQASITSDSKAPWADLVVTIPNDRDHASLVALVECALVELTHEHVGAVVVSRQVGRSTRTQYVADDLITQLTRSPSTPAERSSEGVASELDTFVVKPVRELQTP